MRLIAVVTSFTLVSALLTPAIAANYSPLYAYSHQQAVASMCEEPDAPRTNDVHLSNSENPTAPPSLWPWSFCNISICIVSACGGSLCIGSGCGFSLCGLTGCGFATICIRQCGWPTAPSEPLPSSHMECITLHPSNCCEY